MKRSMAALAAAVFAVLPATALAQGGDGAQSETSEEIQLEAAELTVKKDTIAVISQDDMKRKTADNMWQALKGEPGVNLGVSGNRGETTINIRGSSRYQVGLYVDDIPIATAYRDEWDAGSIMTYGLESIEVSKGYSSPLLATNSALAGAVNVRTAKPAKELDFTAKFMNYFDRKGDSQGYTVGASVGSRQEKFYLKVSAVQDNQDFFTLPSSFRSGKFEDGGRRENSDYDKRNINLMFGLTPTDEVDIMFGYAKFEMEKGQPINAAPDGQIPAIGGTGQRTRAFRWPSYDNERYYVNANIDLSPDAHMKFIAYHDEHIDESVGYTDATFKTILNNSNQFSKYDQSTTGGQLQFGYTFNEAHKVALSAGYRELTHKQYVSKYQTVDTKPGMLSGDIKEAYWDFGGEYSWKALDPLTLVLGLSHTRSDPKKIEWYETSTKSADFNQKTSMGGKASKDSLFNYQLGVFYDLAQEHQLFMSYAKKSRFGTMRERFYRNGTIFSNPDLDPEHANHYEAGYRGLIDGWLQLDGSVFYSDTKDKIVQSRNSAGDTIFINVDRAKTYGFELALEAAINDYISAGATVSHLKWRTQAKNESEKNLTEAPKWQGSIYAAIKPIDSLTIIPQLDFSSEFYNDSDPDPTARGARLSHSPLSPGYAVANLKVTYDLNEHFTFDLGVKNMFDQKYYYSWYYPEAGRSYYAGITARY